MRIFILTDLYPPYYLGGYELKCKLHVEELMHRGYDVHVLTSRWKVGTGAVDGSVYRLLHFSPLDKDFRLAEGRPDPLRLSKRYYQLKWALECRKNYRVTRDLMASLKPELVFVWNMAGVGISPVLVAQDQGIPIVFRLGDYWLANLKYDLVLQPNPLRRRYQAAILGLRDFGWLDLGRVLVVSRALMEHYIELGFPEQNFTVIPNGVPSQIILDTDVLASLPKSGKQIRLVLVGRLSPEKGVHIAIEAVAKLIGQMGLSNIQLDIVGTGPEDYVRQLREKSSNLGLDDHIKFVGFLEHRQVLERMLEYSAALIPSLWQEPLAGTIAEAMARGLPVIATDRGGTSEIISDGENGLLVPPGDPVRLAGAVKRLIDSPDLSQKIRRTALATVRENYTHERLVDRVEAYLKMVLR